MSKPKLQAKHGIWFDFIRKGIPLESAHLTSIHIIQIIRGTLSTIVMTLIPLEKQSRSILKMIGRFVTEFDLDISIRLVERQ